jgi:hypothetical protein
VTSDRDHSSLAGQRIAHYRELLAASDADSVHDLVVRHGPEILDRDLPYLIVAARNQLRSEMRRGSSRYDTPVSEPPQETTVEGSAWDPLARVMAHERLRELAEAMAGLDPRDVLVLWAHAAGHSDAEIIEQWNRLGFSPLGPTAVAIRKRRERAGQLVRDRLSRPSATDL